MALRVYYALRSPRIWGISHWWFDWWSFPSANTNVLFHLRLSKASRGNSVEWLQKWQVKNTFRNNQEEWLEVSDVSDWYGRKTDVHSGYIWGCLLPLNASSCVEQAIHNELLKSPPGTPQPHSGSIMAWSQFSSPSTSGTVDSTRSLMAVALSLLIWPQSWSNRHSNSNDFKNGWQLDSSVRSPCLCYSCHVRRLDNCWRFVPLVILIMSSHQAGPDDRQ